MATTTVDGFTISIDSNDLNVKGLQGKARAQRAAIRLSDMERRISSLLDLWEGVAAESYYVDLVRLLREIQQDFESFSAYADVLIEVAHETDIVAAETKAIADQALEDAQRAASMFDDSPNWATNI